MWRQPKQRLTTFIKWTREQTTYHSFRTLVIVAFLAWLIDTLWVTVAADRTGFENKTLWDWLDLLIVPVVLALAAWWLNRTDKKTEREIADKRLKEERAIAHDEQEQIILDAYFDRMIQLLKEGLSTLDSDDELIRIARILTFTTLKSIFSIIRGGVKSNVILSWR